CRPLSEPANLSYPLPYPQRIEGFLIEFAGRGQALTILEPAQGITGLGSERAIDRPGVKPDRFEPYLHPPHQGQSLGLGGRRRRGGEGFGRLGLWLWRLGLWLWRLGLWLPGTSECLGLGQLGRGHLFRHRITTTYGGVVVFPRWGES